MTRMRRRGHKNAVAAVARTNATAPINGNPTLKLAIRMLQVAGLAAALLLTQVGCVESGQEPVTDNPAMASPVPEGAERGTVLETMNSGGYCLSTTVIVGYSYPLGITLDG
jgi:hypothetical protein